MQNLTHTKAYTGTNKPKLQVQTKNKNRKRNIQTSAGLPARIFLTNTRQILLLSFSYLGHMGTGCVKVCKSMMLYSIIFCARSKAICYYGHLTSWLTLAISMPRSSPIIYLSIFCAWSCTFMFSFCCNIDSIVDTLLHMV